METPQISERNDGDVDCKHKVFLCHSGEQKDFVESIHDEIERHDRSAFFDKSRRSLSLGCDFPREIFKAIEESEVGVVVLSQAFFTKTVWPMEEFARLAKRNEENKDFVLILVLYDIELAECRNVTNQMEWKQQWEEWARSRERIVMKDWTSVFKLFGPTLSISYDKVGGAKRLIREVVAEVCKLVTPETRGDDLDMQGRQRICELSWGKMQASRVSRVDGPRVVGFYGVGGIGKSTLCKALCEKLRSNFGGRVCHAELASNIDEGKEKELLGEMVKRLIGTPHEVVVGYNSTERLNLLMGKLRNQKVFLAVDNVGDGASTKKQARALLEARFAKDSFVVVTARTIEMLRDVGISGGECHEMPDLDYEEAKSLFLNNAPAGVHSKDAFTKKCVDMCYFSKGVGERYHYHPLALKVLGGQLGSDPEEWMPRLGGKDPFNALREREHPINSILRCSFDSLESEDQLLLMDVALFFPQTSYYRGGYLNDVNILTWLRMLHGSSKEDLMLRLKVLKRRSLIEWDKDGTGVVGMHDMWREFCVIETRRSDSRGQRWFYRVDEMHESFEERKFYGGGWENLQRVGLVYASLLWSNSMEVRRVNLPHCSNLTVLQLVRVHLENEVVDVSPLLQLKILEVEVKCWQATIDIRGLGVLLDLCVLIWVGVPSNSASIGEIASLVNLEVLVLSALWAYEISTNKPGIIRVPDLRDLCCLRLVRLAMGRLRCQLVWSSMVNLQCLNLQSNREMLSCDGLEDLVGLVELDLSSCSDLEVLSCLGKLTKLKRLNIGGCRILVVPGLDRLVALQEFNSRRCKRLKSLPDLQLLSNLKVLELSEYLVEPIRGLEKLTSLLQLWVHFDTVKYYPNQLQLTKMQILSIDSWGSRGLPCMVGWTWLEDLTITGCHGVRILKGLETLSSLKSLRIVGCDFWDISVVSCLTSLRTLRITKCKELEQVPSLDQLSKLELLLLQQIGSVTWEVHGTLPQLQDLYIYSVTIHYLPDLNKFPQLVNLRLSGCHFLINVNSDGPLATLEEFCIENCGSLESLPSFKGFYQLKIVKVENCPSLKLMPDFGDSELLDCIVNGERLRIREGKYLWEEE